MLSSATRDPIKLETEYLHQTGMIGQSYTGITTTLGAVEAKRTTAWPEMGALCVRLLYEAGVDPAEGRVAVVTNDFHIARSELIAAREGYGDVAGIPAPLPWVHLEINYTLREAFAMVKTFLFD